MAVRKFNPVTPGQRHKIISAFDAITASTPEKSLLEPLRKTGGRNNQGRMTMRYIGGGHKRKYRIIDFKRNKDGTSMSNCLICEGLLRGIVYRLLRTSTQSEMPIVATCSKGNRKSEVYPRWLHLDCNVTAL